MSRTKRSSYKFPINWLLNLGKQRDTVRLYDKICYKTVSELTQQEVDEDFREHCEQLRKGNVNCLRRF